MFSDGHSCAVSTDTSDSVYSLFRCWADTEGRLLGNVEEARCVFVRVRVCVGVPERTLILFAAVCLQARMGCGAEVSTNGCARVAGNTVCLRLCLRCNSVASLRVAFVSFLIVVVVAGLHRTGDLPWRP